MAKFITPERLSLISKSMDWLETVKESDGDIFVGNSLEDFDVEKTNALSEIQKLNTRREILIKGLTK